VALGPGLGRSDGLAKLAGWLYRDYEGPLVVDADGLNALAGNASLSRHAGPRILTPHPGEFGRLLAGETRGAADADEEKSSVEQGVDFAARHAVTLVLKGHRTLVTDGRHRIFNTTGNPGLATGGTGDVLTGVILALLGQKFQPLSAAQLGVHVHGLAGDLAAEQFGQVSLIASDLPDFLAAALRTVSDT
jgi:NAD(P)H-hydrate epimerase